MTTHGDCRLSPQTNKSLFSAPRKTSQEVTHLKITPPLSTLNCGVSNQMGFHEKKMHLVDIISLNPFKAKSGLSRIFKKISIKIHTYIRPRGERGTKPLKYYLPAIPMVQQDPNPRSFILKKPKAIYIGSKTFGSKLNF